MASLFPLSGCAYDGGLNTTLERVFLKAYVWKEWTGSQNENTQSLCLTLNYDFAAVYSYVMFIQSNILNLSAKWKMWLRIKY